MPTNSSDYQKRYMKNWRERNAERNRELARDASSRRNLKLRTEALDVLGGKCVRCGFDDRRALQIDHVNGGGTAERKLLYPNALLRKVIANPSKYQILCANCNWIKRSENKEAQGRPRYASQ
jgi:hypothetical protein